MNATRNAWVFAVVISYCLGPALSVTVAQRYESHARLLLGTETNRTASLRIGDLDADGDLDVVVANGRHWPQQNYAFLNQGRARFNVMRPLGIDRSTTYACELADLDGDGDLDVVAGNDMAPCQIFLNDGKASFRFHGTFGEISSVRSLTLTDIDQDGDPDILI
ncbi:MAG: VCBS repeat-containing protein, partial [Planctomycetota bacterium]|nr:VCBS repeat-containing protein [Planctomycetota bacterium]